MPRRPLIRAALVRAARHRLPARTLVPAGLRQTAALIAVGTFGTVALGATAAATRSVSHELIHPVAAGHSITTPATPQPSPRAARPSHPAARRHGAKRGAPAHRAVAAPPQAVTPRLPSGTGMWIYEWKRSNHGNARSVVSRALRSGLSTLFVRTGSSHDGFTGAAVLRALLPATRHTSVHVVAWDFPALWHPRADAARLARAAWYLRGHGGPHVVAVAPDIETPAEGTFNAKWRVWTYLAALRHDLPRDVSILTTVPWPSRSRIALYPYPVVARFSDALLPMAYWYDNSPVTVTRTSLVYLRRFHRPVDPVGQGYDSKLDVPSLPHSNLRRQVPAFLVTAHAYGASAVSVWSWQSAPGAVWVALSYARRLFPAHS